MSSRLSTRLVAALIAVIATAGCGNGAESPSPIATSPGTSPSPPVTTPPATGSPTDAATPTTAPGGEAFTCELPIVDAGAAPMANIVDVRIGTHSGYDRFVIEFAQGTPEFTLDRAEPPFVEAGSGRPVEVDGAAFLELVMRGGTKQTDEGTSSYEGRTEFETGFPMLVHAVESGDFERQSTWVLGLAAEACVRMLLLDEPPRLVIDVEH